MAYNVYVVFGHCPVEGPLCVGVVFPRKMYRIYKLFSRRSDNDHLFVTEASVALLGHDTNAATTMSGSMPSNSLSSGLQDPFALLVTYPGHVMHLISEIPLRGGFFEGWGPAVLPHMSFL